MTDQDKTDEILGIVRCARCGHRLDGEIDCPFCSLFAGEPRKHRVPKWVFITACFLTSPISIYVVIRTDRLNRIEKMLAISGCILWVGLYRFL